jgi:uncharacterized protein YaaQ
VRLVIAVVERRAAGTVTERLRAAGFASTRLASTGGFLQRGSVTLFAGVEDDQVDAVLATLREAGDSSGRGDPAQPGTGVAFVANVDAVRRV